MPESERERQTESVCSNTIRVRSGDVRMSVCWSGGGGGDWPENEVVEVGGGWRLVVVVVFVGGGELVSDK